MTSWTTGSLEYLKFLHDKVVNVVGSSKTLLPLFEVRLANFAWGFESFVSGLNGEGILRWSAKTGDHSPMVCMRDLCSF